MENIIRPSNGRSLFHYLIITTALQRWAARNVLAMKVYIEIQLFILLYKKTRSDISDPMSLPENHDYFGTIIIKINQRVPIVCVADDTFLLGEYCIR